MGGNAKLVDQVGIDGGPGFVLGAIEVSGDSQAGLGLGGAKEVEDFLVAVQRLSGPVLGDFREEAMLDGIPLGGAGGIVSDGHRKMEAIAELELEVGFPGPATAPIAAAIVSQNEQLWGVAVTVGTFAVPPFSDGMGGEAGRVMGNADEDRAAVGDKIVNAVGNRHAEGVGAEVGVIDQARGAVPGGTGVAEIANQFALFGIDADDGQTLALESVAQRGEVVELLVAIRTGSGGELLAIDAQRIIHLVEKAGHGVGGNRDAGLLEQFRDLLRGLARPTETGDGIARGVMLQQDLDTLD